MVREVQGRSLRSVSSFVRTTSKREHLDMAGRTRGTYCLRRVPESDLGSRGGESTCPLGCLLAVSNDELGGYGRRGQTFWRGQNELDHRRDGGKG